MKRLLIITLIAILLLSLAACGKCTPLDDPADSIIKPAASTLPPPTTEPEAEIAPTKEPVPSTASDPADTLSAFRQNMDSNLMAIADLGFPALSEDFEILDYLLDEYPQWMAVHDFIGSIPEDQRILACDEDGWGNLLCIVPQDPMATVCVNAVVYTDTEPYEELDTEVLYRKESGEPILLLADISETRRIHVAITDNTGESISFSPYWEYLEDEKFSDLVMDFTPVSEKTAYDNALSYGWIVPDDSFLTDHFWQSDYGYKLELLYSPGEIYDGDAYIYGTNASGDSSVLYEGVWGYADGNLHLHMRNLDEPGQEINDDFPVLSDPFGEGWLSVFRTPDGVGLPHFDQTMEYDQLSPDISSENPYAYALSQGWGVPELSELVDTFWLSRDYGIDLLEDAVPGDNSGKAIIYDVSEGGAYTQSYSGSWNYEEGMLHLLLVPQNGDGYFVDDSFPVLILDEELWIGRNENGAGLPHFYDDQLTDILEQPKG